MNSKTHDMATIGILSALAVALGYAFIFVPNVEMVSASIFIAGYLLGVKKGILVAVLAETVYSVFNPMGSSLARPHLLAAQVIGMMVFGAAGGFIASRTEKFVINRKTIAIFVITGIASTFIYDLLTTLAWPVAAGFSAPQIYATIAIGAIFYSLHIVSNAMIFAIVVPSVIKAISRSGRFS